jgi:hypothetical protein
MEVSRVAEQGEQIIEHGPHTLLRHVATYHCQGFASGVTDDCIWALDGCDDAGDKGIDRRV